MRMTSKTRYAVTALADLFLHSDQGFVSIADISRRQNISMSYLSHLFADMAKHQIVTSQKGPGGGYKLGKDASDISLADIISSVDGSIDNRRCKGKQNCQNNHICLTHSLWENLNDRMQSLLTDVSLADAVSKNSATPAPLQHNKLVAMQL